MGHPSRSLIAMVGTAMLVAVMAIPKAASAGDDTAHSAEVRVILATKCAAKKVDPRIGEPAPPQMGFECFQFIDKKTVTFAGSKASMTLPDRRVLQLVHTGKAGTKHKLSGSLSAADGGPANQVGNISAEPNVPINIGIKQTDDSAIFLTIRILS